MTIVECCIECITGKTNGSIQVLITSWRILEIQAFNYGKYRLQCVRLITNQTSKFSTSIMVFHNSSANFSFEQYKKRK